MNEQMQRKAEERAEQRKRELTAIHTGKRHLGWDEATYRNMLEAWTGKRSSGAMNQAERHLVLENMRKAGFERKNDAEKTPKVAVATGDKPQVKKIKTLWLRLYRAGKVENPSPQALNAYVRRMTDVDHVNWLTTTRANTVIESLKKWLDRTE